MFKFLTSFFWKTSLDDDASLSLDEAYSMIKECEDKTKERNRVVEIEEEDNDIRSYEVFNKTGRVTKIEDDIYTVDDLYEFTTDVEDINVGTKISYQLLRDNEELKVVDVHVLENDWNVVDTGKKIWHDRILICMVSGRDGRILTLFPGDIKINLNQVRSEFIPIVGDWVELDVKCEIDENVIDLNGKIIEVNKLGPMRPQMKVGHVTQWTPDSYTGVINRNIFFDKDSLFCGYLPVENDKVVAEIIESNQGTCNWRALKVIPDYLHAIEGKNFQMTTSEEPQDSQNIVTITDNVNITFTKVGEMKLFLMDIASSEDVQLICIELPRVNGQCSLCENVDHVTIKANAMLTVRLECQAKNVGETRELVIFHFESFKVGRWVTIHVATMYGKVPNKAPKNAPKHVVPRIKKETIRGPKIQSVARFLPVQMPDYPVPERLLNIVVKHRQDFSNNTLKFELEKIKPCLITPLNYMNFEDKFHTLLHLDEIHNLIEMQTYDREKAFFVRSGEYLLLEIENLAERRPSVIPGDRVVARNLKNDKSPDFEGYIHKMAKNFVFIKFSSIFHDSYDGEFYSVYIIASRATYRREHFAVNLAVRNLGKDWLFPTKITEKDPQLDFIYDKYVDTLNPDNESESPSKSPPNVLGKRRLLEKIQQFDDNPEEKLPVRKLEWYNSQLNFYQKEAIRNILLGVCRPLPYIIFGPPGTGKSVTIVETVLQILRLMPHSRILLCAPSNSAADLLALRLIDSNVLKPGDIIRLVAMTAVPNVPVRLAPYCATANVEREGTETSLPVVTSSGLVLGYSSKVLGRHRITVCTCSTAGVLCTMGFSKGHFSHIIVDEAGQTSEPGVLIPLAFLDLASGQAILAGDPMQLGPVVISKIAAEYGLEESFLERMISRFPYMRDSHGFPKTCGYDPRLITKLIYNYRSLPDLLKLPSSLFYNDDLIPTISETDSKESAILRQLETILPKTNEGKISSVIFHGVVGENFQNDDSPSWFNPCEAYQVFYYVNEIFRLGLRSEDVGIITPYKAQAKHLMELFKEADFDPPKVGTVEEFQGQEYNVVILSTVRSNNKYFEADIKYTMGFIASPRRLNVAITRAKALMIVIGNPGLLSSDRCWRSVINYCADKKSYLGFDINKK